MAEDSKEEEQTSSPSPPVPAPTPVPDSDPLHQTPSIPVSTHHPHLQSFFKDVVEAANPPLRHLASHSSLASQNSHRSRGSNEVSVPRSVHTRRQQIRPLSTAFEEQRHPGKPGHSITKSTKEWNPEAPSEYGSMSSYPGHRGKNPLNEIMSISGSAKYGSESTTLYSYPRSSVVDESTVGKYKEIEIDAPKLEEVGGLEKETKAEEELNNQHENGNIYPGPLGLFLLLTGIALSVFLISLDRTIITTAVPFIENEFNSYSDVGWYGSAYLLTASAFQPLYGRIYTIFNMKWSYLSSLFLFLLGSLICGVAPNSVALIVGRAIAGLGSAGILTGSFVVVAHAVPLNQRPLLTAVVGLMFGVGATVGPLLGGVFTDLVTWRWCFYFNLPVGGATAFAMILFFHPPKKHSLMGKSFFYRVMELDLLGNVFLLAASVMLFLALQYTEERVPWSSPLVIGLLVGCGVTFIVFIAWQWWKQDGALMPPRILQQRTVAAACASAFCIYSAILIQTYYLPQWFQAVKGDSATHAGVNMIPYVAANAVFSLLAGIFVSKNGYFTAPAIIGMCIGTVGCGLISTIGPDTSSSKWIGYEILASAGIGMAIQQGFTAIQIVLPLDDVAVGTAAVVAFQSLGGAIFISVGNTILQNSLLDADLPGVNKDAVITAGASAFRQHVTAEQLPMVVNVYNKALNKVFIAAIPMAGLAVIASCFMEWRNVKDQRKSDVEAQNKTHARRGEVEKSIYEAHRRSGMSGTTALN